MVDNGYSMYEDILNFPKKVVELGGGGKDRKEYVIFHTFVNLRSALSLRIEEEKESLIYLFSQATFQPPPPPFKYINMWSTCPHNNKRWLYSIIISFKNQHKIISVIGIYHLEHYFNITVESPCATMSCKQPPLLSNHLSIELLWTAASISDRDHCLYISMRVLRFSTNCFNLFSATTI